MIPTFIELAPFERSRHAYLDDDAFQALQEALAACPDAGDVIPGTGGLRKVRFADRRRRKGTRGGLRVIYYWWQAGLQFWLCAIYDKDEVPDLSPMQRSMLGKLLKAELNSRN
ncbi:MAG: toxin [Lysobacter sp.]|nr:toxin [Lysobacter sp.]